MRTLGEPVDCPQHLYGAAPNKSKSVEQGLESGSAGVSGLSTYQAQVSTPSIELRTKLCPSRFLVAPRHQVAHAAALEIGSFGRHLLLYII